MTLKSLILTLPLALGFAGGAMAHDGAHADMAKPDFELPAACKASGMGDLKGMQSHMSQAMQSMPGQMSDAQKGLQQAMMGMNGPMMQGMMAKDADVAWICAMIPHHQGAIAMAQVGLKNGNNAEAKKMAEKTIKEQEKSIAELKTWLDKNAQKEGGQ
ncbi:DUF305 domain-containing protein [Methylorubrum thiocyanatum]|uniref:DUF305 domain-containing protein n=1 Tax=Methylorubrum thiocyanatum TaxID=47958 RepID=UPI0035C7E7FE